MKTISNFAHRFFPRELYKRVDNTINLEENPQLCPAKIAVFFKSSNILFVLILISLSLYYKSQRLSALTSYAICDNGICKRQDLYD